MGEQIVLRPGKRVTHRMALRLEGWSGRRGARGCAALLACVGFALVLGAVGRSATGSAPSFAAAKSYATGKRARLARDRRPERRRQAGPGDRELGSRTPSPCS